MEVEYIIDVSGGYKTYGELPGGTEFVLHGVLFVVPSARNFIGVSNDLGTRLYVWDVVENRIETFCKTHRFLGELVRTKTQVRAL